MKYLIISNPAPDVTRLLIKVSSSYCLELLNEKESDYWSDSQDEKESDYWSDSFSLVHLKDNGYSVTEGSKL
jgi:hypothetical protein